MAMLLVVEDDPFVRTSATTYLNCAGFTTLEADCCSLAVALLEQHPDITHVFSDVVLLGEANGLSLAQAIRRRWPQVRVMVTSGALPNPHERIPPDVEFMPKPYDLERVVEWVEHSLEPASLPPKNAPPSADAGDARPHRDDRSSEAAPAAGSLDDRQGASAATDVPCPHPGGRR